MVNLKFKKQNNIYTKKKQTKTTNLNLIKYV